MLERARADRPPIAILADRIASRFVIGVLTVTTAAAAWWWFAEPARAFDVALATLVVTCPCALALATPAAIAAATARLAKSGFLLVRSRVLEVFNEAKVIVFDKTGTLTKGRPVVLGTDVLRNDAPPVDRLLSIAASIETASEHVLARAFSLFSDRRASLAEDVSVVPGHGVAATIDDTRYRIGAAGFVARLAGAETPPAVDDGNTSAWLGDDCGLLARFDIGDELRNDAKSAVSELAALGYRPVIASGDKEAAVERVASALGVSEWHARLSPADKLELIRDLRASGDAVIMVGDGINDAPVLAAADTSIAMDAGTALARASADAVALGRHLGTIVTAARIARQTRRIIRQNIAWAIVYNVTAVPLAVAGMLAPWMAAIGMSASSLIVVMNALRLHREAA
jgi:Cu2+-exporting ATPase